MKLKNECMKKIQALADENRLKIIGVLIKKPCCVNHISDEVGLKQYNISKHLKILEYAGLVTQKKDGQKRVYALTPAASKNLTINKSKLILPCCSFDFNKLRE